MRIVLAGVLGAIAMFVWTSVAHIATPLADAGIGKLADEAPLLAEMQKDTGGKDGLYIYPWTDPKDPKMMEKYAALVQRLPSGLLLYHAPGARADMTRPMIFEFVKELIVSLIAAFLLGVAGVGSYLGRAGFVGLIGVAVALTTDASLWIWYGFPSAYILADMVITLVGYLVAGLAMAAVLKPKAAAA